MIPDEYDGTIARISLLSPRGEPVISRAAGEVAGKSSCWNSARPAFGILRFLYILCCYRCRFMAYAWMSRYPLFSFAGVIFSCAVSPHGHGVYEDHFPMISSSATPLAAIIICVRDGCNCFCVRTLLYMFMFEFMFHECLTGSRVMRLAFCLASSIRVVVLCRQFVRFL